MTSDIASVYALNAGAWTCVGVAIGTVGWRVYYHRKLVQRGQTVRDTPLALIVGALVVLVVTASVLFSQSGRLTQAAYVRCQAQVNQNNVDTINDRSKSTITGLVNEVKFYQSLAAILSSPDPSLRADVLSDVNQQIRIDTDRLAGLRDNPLQPVSDCRQPES